MKKIVVVMAVCSFLAGYALPAFAGGAGWHSSQRRMRTAHDGWLKQEAQLWKKFDAAMAEAKARTNGHEKKEPQPGAGAGKK
ncbi:MAG: hypothetical protein RDU20_18275 [Desulfomonilaceae bacterium]|nr:hypothetical protein [Desulfomonilaceae bacterium]